MADDTVLKGKLEELQKEYSKTKYNKATNKHLGLLRAKIARVKEDIIKAGKGRKGSGFFVKKQGDATVALIGFPSAGKSSLINEISNAQSRVAAWAFTTTTVVPGVIMYKGAHIQILDLPGIIEGAHIGEGGGRTVISAAKIANLVVFVIDATVPEQLDLIMHEFLKLDIFINRQRPDISILDSKNQGLKLEINKSGLTKDTIAAIFQGFGLYHSMVKIKSVVSEDELISYVSGKSTYINAIVALNKVDLLGDYSGVMGSISKKYGIEVIPISILNHFNLGMLVDRINDNLNIMRIYLKPRLGEKGEPMIVKTGITVGEVARKLHTEILDEFKCAYIDGPSAKFKNQRAGVTHILKDGDTVTFIKNK